MVILFHSEFRTINTRIAIGSIVGIHDSFVQAGIFDDPCAGKLAWVSSVLHGQDTDPFAVPLSENTFWILTGSGFYLNSARNVSKVPP